VEETMATLLRLICAAALPLLIGGRSTGSEIQVRSIPAVHEAASLSSNQFEFVAADGTYRMAVRDDLVVLSRNAEAAAIHRLQDVQTSRGITKPILERVAYADLGSDLYFVLSFGTITHASFFRGVRIRKGDLTPLWDEVSPFGVGGNKLIDGNVVYAHRDAFMAAVDLETGKTKWTNVWHDGGQLPSLGDDTRLSVDADGSIVLTDSAWRVVVDSGSGAVRRAERSR
jgi:hypothetical protein